jgi:SAM-dependent methyltransferase
VSAEPPGWKKLLRGAARATVPQSARDLLRSLLREVPCRIRDALPDLLETLHLTSSAPLPPPRLRKRVGRTSSRREFLSVGRAAARDVLAVFEDVRNPASDWGRWLDFGCGAGRVARFIGEFPIVRTMRGVDVDAEAIRWNRRHMTGDYLLLAGDAPLPFGDKSFDVVFSVSVFSHLDESPQFAWLREIHRVLRPGGLFLASTHSDKLRYSRPDLTFEQHLALNSRGFLFARGRGEFKTDSAFHSRLYLEQQWGRWFSLRLHREFGLAGFQDLTVWERPV